MAVAAASPVVGVCKVQSRTSVSVSSTSRQASQATCLTTRGCCESSRAAIGGAVTTRVQGREFFSGAALRRFAFGRRLNTRNEGHGSAVRVEAACEAEPAAESTSANNKIWLSDVPVTRSRPYFLNRKWTAKDLTYGGFLAFMHGLCLLAPFTFTWQAFGVFVLLYVITGMFGITLSFHRNLSHKSFKLPKWLEYTFAYCGVQAVQGDPLEWVSSHRYHHQHCDTDRDPHSPYEGFWHSHMGWLLDDQSTNERVGSRSNIGDMENDAFYKFIQKTYPLHPAMMAVVLFALGGVPYVVWGMAVRAVWVYHITWFVNSASHVWGTQQWNTGDLSRNNWWVALLAFGEGWHNNHHAFEYSARHGLEWWQLDPTWYVVRALEAVGLATKVKLPRKEHMAKLAMPTAS